MTAARAVDPAAILRRLLVERIVELNEWRPHTRFGPRTFAELAPDLRKDYWSIVSPERPGLLDISQPEHDYLIELQASETADSTGEWEYALDNGHGVPPTPCHIHPDWTEDMGREWAARFGVKLIRRWHTTAAGPWEDVPTAPEQEQHP